MRPSSPEDAERLRGMFSRLSRETAYHRFHSPLPRVPAAWADRLLGADGGESVIAVAGDEVVGHAMYAGVGADLEAEVAVVVEDGWQSRGVGKLLLARLAERARSAGVEAFWCVALGENDRALGLTRAAFGEVRCAIKDGTYLIRAPLRSSKPVPDATVVETSRGSR